MQNKSTPLLSICLPTFNRAAVIPLSLQSILSRIQERHNGSVEIIVRDNGSTDETPQVLFDIAAHNRDIAIRLIRSENNEGYDSNIFKLYGLAKGKYIWFWGDRYMLNADLGHILDCLEKYSPAYFGFSDYFTVNKARIDSQTFNARFAASAVRDSALNTDLLDIVDMAFMEALPLFASLPAVIFERNITDHTLQKIWDLYVNSQFMHIPLAVESIKASTTKKVCVYNTPDRAYFQELQLNSMRFNPYLTTRGMRDIYAAYPLIGSYTQKDTFNFFFLNCLVGYKLGIAYFGIKKAKEVREALEKLEVKMSLRQKMSLLAWDLPFVWMYRLPYLLSIMLKNIRGNEKRPIVKTFVDMMDFDRKVNEFELHG